MQEEENMEAILAKAAATKGLIWGNLTLEEKQNLYRDYVGEREQADAQYGIAADMINQPEAEMLGNSRIQQANWGGSIGNAFKAAAGAKIMQDARKKQDDLSAASAQGRETAGGLGVTEEDERRKYWRSLFGGAR